MRKRKTSRREFIQRSALVGAGCYFASGSPARSAPDSPLNRLNIGIVGVGGKGDGDCENAVMWGAQVVGLCDIDDLTLKKKSLAYKEAKKFNDWREMLDKLGDQLDAITVSTPDHSHAVASIAAMRMKKHVYCQKPLTWSIEEARRMRAVASEMGVVTQMGNQGTSENGVREAVEVVRSGAIGDVKEVHVWTNRPIWDQGIGRPPEAVCPDGIHWDLFLGPAPERPYAEAAYHPFAWRGWLDFGTGALGDMGCHTANMAVMALDLFDPIAFQAIANSGIVENESYPDSSVIKYEFGPRGPFPACTMYWYDGGNLPGADVIADTELPESFQKTIAEVGRDKAMKSGSLLVGTKGKLFSPSDYGAAYFLLPEKDYANYTKPSQTLPRVLATGNTDQRHMSEFISACKGETQTMSNFGHASRLTETILCGNLALRTSNRIEWDAAGMRSTNCEEVNKFVRREYRKGYSI